MGSKKIAFSRFQGDCEFSCCILGLPGLVPTYVILQLRSNNCESGGKFTFAFIAPSHLNVGLRYIATHTHSHMHTHTHQERREREQQDMELAKEMSEDEEDEDFS